MPTAAGVVRGHWRGDSAAFLGVPFARAPVGELRFAAPVPPQPWQGVRDATAYGATAQRGDPGVTLIPEPSVPGGATLNVNVFTPRPGEPGAALPVLVFIHGGGFVAGSPASPWYDGRAFNRDGIVTVSVSYRLGFDGFGHIDGAPSNRAVCDWLAALEWVQANLAAFGGDPGRVTIAGQSAGGGAVLTLLGLPSAQHLFHAAVSLSGAVADISAERARSRSLRLAGLAGVAPCRDGFCSVPEERLLQLQHEAAPPVSTGRLAPVRALLDDGLPWGPVVDGELLARPTLESLRLGVGAGKPLILGATDDEFTGATDDAAWVLRFVPASPALRLLLPEPTTRQAWLAANGEQRRLGTAAVLGRYVTDRMIRSTVVRAAQARGRADTWVYRFSWPSPTKRWALHCLDVPFWFDCLDAPGVAAVAGDAPPRALAGTMHTAVTAFIRDGDPGWTPWSAQPGATRVFGGPAGTPEAVPDGYTSVLALA